uniref:Uncharacterized protein n=1 Tax=Panagrolaimus sp. ES5 TaxID=591445 RepID=A0AC34FSL5_9BILA
MYIYRNDTSLLVIPMEKGAVKFRQIKNGIYEIIILSSKLYDLSFDLRLKIRHIKTTEVRGFSKEEENYYLKYAKTIENFNGENKEDAFARTKFKLPNKSEPNVLRTKISDLRTLIELLCNPETGDHDNVPIDKRYHQQVNSLLMPTEAWRVHKPRSTTFNKQINTYRQIREIRWSKVDLQKYDFENIDADNVEKIQFENMKIFDNKKELPKCFQNMEFENLTTLIYKYCKIIEISDEIAQKLPVTLKELDLSFNNITSISIDISRLTKLEILCLDNNLLLTTPRIPWKSLPSSILQLYLKFTSIAEIPDEIQNLVNLQHLSIGSWCLMNISWKNISKSIRKIYVESAVIINEIELNDKCNLEKLSIEKAVLRVSIF